MFDTLLAMLMSAIFAYQLGLYHGAKWSTDNSNPVPQLHTKYT